MMVNTASQRAAAEMPSLWPHAARRSCRHGNIRFGGSGARGRRGRRGRPVRRLLGFGRPVMPGDGRAEFTSRYKNSDHLDAALGQAPANIGAGTLGRHIATGAILVLGRMLRLHRLHAVAHGVFDCGVGCNGRPTQPRAHLRRRPRRSDRCERQRDCDQDRQDGAQALQDWNSFHRLIYHERPYQVVKTRTREHAFPTSVCVAMTRKRRPLRSNFGA